MSYTAVTEVEITIDHVDYIYTIELHCPSGHQSFDAHNGAGVLKTHHEIYPNYERACVTEVTCHKYFKDGEDLISQECSGPHSKRELMDLIKWDEVRWEEI